MNVVIMLICVVVIFVIAFCVKKHNKAKAKARALEEKWFMNAKMEQIKAVNNKIQKEILENGLPPFLQNSPNPKTAFIEMNVARKAVFALESEVRCVPKATAHYTALHILSLYKDKWL